MATTTYPTQDSQKGKLYAAERSTEWTTKASELISEAEVTALATKACKWLYSKGYRPCTTHPTVAFPGNGRGGAWASRGQRKLSFTPAARKRWVVLHEVAHLVLPSNHPEYDGDDRPHGWCFADVYLKLVSRFCGRSNANALKAQLKARKVRIRPKRKLTEAQRSAAADRLAAHRPERKPATRWALETTLPDGTTAWFSGRVKDVTTHASNDGRTWHYVWHCTTSPGRRLTRVSPVALDAKARELDPGTYRRYDWRFVEVGA